jgi:hypothetical protein
VDSEQFADLSAGLVIGSGRGPFFTLGMSILLDISRRAARNGMYRYLWAQIRKDNRAM